MINLYLRRQICSVINTVMSQLDTAHMVIDCNLPEYVPEGVPTDIGMFDNIAAQLEPYGITRAMTDDPNVIILNCRGNRFMDTIAISSYSIFTRLPLNARKIWSAL
ncbi:hypothetical protein GD1_119 [Paraglaciecola Antarctic GD virus 1]|nr:hypothetical protein GD1_119 [Paraglaciecola Antarctic GD virus 1]